MKAISQKLTVVCLLFLALSIAIVVLYETDTLASGLLADDKQSEFILTFIMELLSLGAAFAPEDAPLSDRRAPPSWGFVCSSSR